MQVENRIASLVVDAADAGQLGQFWAGALGWQVVDRGSCGVSIGVDGGPFEIDVRFVPDGPKLTKNRLHLDVKPVHRDQAAGLGRLPALGARQVGVGQGAQIVRPGRPKGQRVLPVPSLMPCAGTSLPGLVGPHEARSRLRARR